jgi:phosphonate transport system permease protein
VPVVAPRFVSLALYRWEVVLRETVVVGLVGAGGLGRLLAQQNAAFDEPRMLTTIAALIVAGFAVDVVSGRVRAALR